NTSGQTPSARSDFSAELNVSTFQWSFGNLLIQLWGLVLSGHTATLVDCCFW
ncbi:8133_t:CDS:2, partial [Scutellospora calospora]